MTYHSKRYPIVKIKARAWRDERPVIFTVTGKTAKTLFALVKHDSKGVTALELSNTWALRLSQYISDLRHKHNLDIIMQREKHDDAGGWHGRYFLHTQVDILESE